MHGKQKFYISVIVTGLLCLASILLAATFTLMLKGIYERDYDEDVNNLSYMDSSVPTLVLTIVVAVLLVISFLANFELGFLLALATTASFIGALVNILKISVAKLRPDFIARCQPDEYRQCTNEDIIFVNEGRVSFPSGHSAWSGYTLVICCLAFVKAAGRATKYKIPIGILVIVVCLILTATAIYVAYSRVRDHKHFVVDAVVGMIFGVVVGLADAPLWHVYRTIVLENDIHVRCWRHRHEKATETLIEQPINLDSSPKVVA